MSNAPSAASRLSEIGADGFVTAEDVLFLRRNVFADGVVSPQELDALFVLGERSPKGDPEWPAFFEEAAADFYLRQEEPQGYLTEAEFSTLKARVTRDGRKASRLELGLLLKLLETAVQAPPALHDFVADQLRRAVLDRGADAAVMKEDVAMLKRFVFAAGGAGNVGVSRAEAELLFDINDATLGLGNDPEWTDLFVKAIVNHLMAHIGYAAPELSEARRRQAFMEEQSVRPGRFLRRMIAGGLGGVGKKETSPQAEANRRREEDAALAEKITLDEADWLAGRIAKDGSLDESERRLVSYLRELGAELPPRLKEIVDRAA